MGAGAQTEGRAFDLDVARAVRAVMIEAASTSTG